MHPYSTVGRTHKIKFLVNQFHFEFCQLWAFLTLKKGFQNCSPPQIQEPIQLSVILQSTISILFLPSCRLYFLLFDFQTLCRVQIVQNTITNKLPAFKRGLGPCIPYLPSFCISPPKVHHLFVTTANLRHWRNTVSPFLSKLIFDCFHHSVGTNVNTKRNLNSFGWISHSEIILWYIFIGVCKCILDLKAQKHKEVSVWA